MRSRFLIAVYAFAIFLFSANLFENFSQIRGKLSKADGKPLAYTEIEMVPVEADKIVVDSRLIATTSTSGFFTFRPPPGKYTLSINFGDKPTTLSPYQTFFYPNATERKDAEIFEIAQNTKPRTIVFKLPPALVERKIIGKVVYPDGNAAPNVWLGLRDVAYDESVSFGVSKTDKLGNFSINALSDREYQIGAILFEANPRAPLEIPKIIGAAESEVFILNAQTAAFKLVLKQRQDYDRFRDKYVGFLKKNPIQEMFSNTD